MLVDSGFATETATSGVGDHEADRAPEHDHVEEVRADRDVVRGQRCWGGGVVGNCWTSGIDGFANLWEILAHLNEGGVVNIKIEYGHMGSPAVTVGQSDFPQADNEFRRQLTMWADVVGQEVIEGLPLMGRSN